MTELGKGVILFGVIVANLEWITDLLYLLTMDFYSESLKSRCKNFLIF